MQLKILNKLNFGAGPWLPTERCGKTNCSNCADPNCVGIACPPWLPAILPLQKAGPYPVGWSRLKTQDRRRLLPNSPALKNPQPVVGKGKCCGTTDAGQSAGDEDDRSVHSRCPLNLL